jgi:hypothetical protein
VGSAHFNVRGRFFYACGKPVPYERKSVPLRRGRLGLELFSVLQVIRITQDIRPILCVLFPMRFASVRTRPMDSAYRNEIGTEFPGLFLPTMVGFGQTHG